MNVTQPTAIEVITSSQGSLLSALFDSVDEQLIYNRAYRFYSRNVYLDLVLSDALSPGAAIKRENTLALNALVSRLAFARLAMLVINTTYPSREHAQAAVDDLRKHADSLSRFADLNDIPVEQDIECIMTIAGQIPQGLSPLRRWTLTNRQCPITLAWDIYCDIDRAGEIAEINSAGTALPNNPYYVCD